MSDGFAQGAEVEQEDPDLSRKKAYVQTYSQTIVEE
jgi:hypothetical protein